MTGLAFGFVDHCRTKAEQISFIAIEGLPSYSVIKDYHRSCIEAGSMATGERTSMAAIATGTKVDRTTVVIVAR
jgi:hypothetical protein